MSNAKKVLAKVLNGQADANIGFADLCNMLVKLDFKMRVRGSHHIFEKEGIKDIVNLQRAGHEAKKYQVKQVREFLEEIGYEA